MSIIECANTSIAAPYLKQVADRKLFHIFENKIVAIFALFTIDATVQPMFFRCREAYATIEVTMKSTLLGCTLLLSASSALAYHPCEPGNVVTDAVEGAVVGGVVGAIAGDAKTGAMIGGAAGVIDGAYDEAECDALIGDAIVEEAVISDYEDAIVEDAIIDSAIDDGW